MSPRCGNINRVSTPGPLSAAVAQACRGIRPQLSPPGAEAVDQLLHQLAQPLRVAVVGRVSSGKSTLVNALIGRRVAATDVGECTRLPTRYGYGAPERTEVVLTDGSRRVLSPGSEDYTGANHLETYLANEVLRDMIVVDTPGLGAVGAEQDPVSRTAIAGAEAVIYVLTQLVRQDDQDALSAFTAATDGRPAGPVNAVAVLNKADTIPADSVPGSGGDQRSAARLLAQRQRLALGPRVTEVVPLIGLLAETTETGMFTAADVDALRRLAAVPPADRDTMLLAADLLLGWECDLPVPDRERLLELLDLHGIRLAVDSLVDNPQCTVGDLRRILAEASGFGELRARLTEGLWSRSDAIKAAAALDALAAIPEQQHLIWDTIELLLARPEAHQLRMMEILTLIASGGVDMPADLLDEVVRLGMNADPPTGSREQQAAYALERAGWWRSYSAFGAGPVQSRIAHVAHRAYFLRWQGLTR
ncbi:GTPase [Pseudonocardiaceae bacterium YIM PH 21723]|nr:GTPase [Pseudonocardiaceae bacterium YIM PH 21723]